MSVGYFTSGFSFLDVVEASHAEKRSCASVGFGSFFLSLQT